MFLAATGSKAQGSVLVNIENRNATLSEVFEQVKRQTSLSVIYSNDDITHVERKDYMIRNATLSEAMSQALEGTDLEYELSNNVIIIRQMQPQTSASQQAVTVVKGKVVDETGAPMAGASIAVIGTSLGANAGLNGEFEIRVPVGTASPRLRISYIGYEMQEVVYKGETITISLAPDVKLMQAAVVTTGIFDRRSESYTAAVSTVTKDQLERVDNRNMLQALKSIDASFQMLENIDFGSDPNRLPDIQMRGSSNFSEMRDRYQASPNQPLFIVDGFETSLTRVLDMDMNRVASITMLKDATAKALYGSKGANGVVVIETVLPEMGRLRASYSGDFTINAPDLTSYDLCNAAEKLEVERLARMYVGTSASSQQDQNQRYAYYLNDVLRGVDTYWLSVPLRTGYGHKHSLFLEGGDQAVRYGINFSYNKNPGVMKGSDRENISGEMSIQYRYGKFIFRDQLQVAFNKANNSPYGSYNEYSRLNPYWRMYNDDGSVREVFTNYTLTNSQGSTPIYNPLINATLNTKNGSSYMDVVNNLYCEWMAFTGMRFKGRFGLVSNREDDETFLPRDHTSFRNIQVGSDEYFNRGSYRMGNGKRFDYNFDVSANYSINLSNHQIYANAQYSVSEKKSEMIYFMAQGFANNRMDYITQAKQYPATGRPTGSESLTREMSVVGSVNYSYDNRYLFDANIRNNASSLFGKDNPWSSYWSLGVGWNMHKEKFMSDLTWMDRLRLRLTTGVSGSQNFASYQAIATYSFNQIVYDNIVGASQMSLANSKLRAQRTHENNLGLDLEFFKSLDLTADFYVRNTDDMLTPVSIPPSTGFSEYTENLGKVRNAGVELRLNYRIVRNSARQTYLSIFASAIHNKNKLMEISDALTAFNEERDASKGTQVPNLDTDHINNKHVTKPSVRYIEGQSMDAIWVVRSYGIDPLSGNEIFMRANGSLTTRWDARDQVVWGDAHPKISGTFGINFEYMGFSINTSLYFRMGGQQYNSTLVNKVENADMQYNVDRRLYTGRWNEENRGVATPFKTFNRGAAFTRPTSRFVQDLNEVQMTSLNLGYDFRNHRFMKDSSISRLRIQTYFNDIFRLSTIKTERGLEYPFARTFSIKVSATF